MGPRTWMEKKIDRWRGYVMVDCKLTIPLYRSVREALWQHVRAGVAAVMVRMKASGSGKSASVCSTPVAHGLSPRASLAPVNPTVRKWW